MSKKGMTIRTPTNEKKRYDYLYSHRNTLDEIELCELIIRTAQRIIELNNDIDIQIKEV